MIPVMQTRHGPKVGNCFSACVASILECPLEDVDLSATTEDWWLAFNELLKSKGLFFVDFPVMTNGHVPEIPLEVYVIVTGPSPRHDCLHSVVGRRGPDPEPGRAWIEYVHDPHPDGAGVKSMTYIGFLVQRDPRSTPSKGISR